MDPLQRSADRRRFQKIALTIGVGLVMLLLSLATMIWLEDDPHYVGAMRGGGPFVGSVLGLVCIAAGVFDLVKRLLTGPTQPGKRARY